MKSVRHGPEHLVIIWCHDRAVRWMPKKLPTKLPELLQCHQRCMWAGVPLLTASNWLFVDSRGPD